MKKKILKILALVLALCLLGGVCYIANGLVGNPVSKALAKRSAQKYLEQNHTDENYEIVSNNYDFKIGGYYIKAAVQDSLDKHFVLYADFFGNISRTTYENDVLLHGNTAMRLNREYMLSFEPLFQNTGLLPFYTHLGAAMLEFADAYETENAPSAFRLEDLQADAMYDLREMGATTGHLYLNVHDDTVSVERVSEILLAVKKAADDMGLTFYDIDCSLNLPFDDQSYATDYDGVAVYAFLYSDIYEEDLVARVQAASEHTEAIYEKEAPIETDSAAE